MKQPSTPSSPTSLEKALSATLQRRRKASTLRQLTTYPANCTDFSSNDFLSLASSPALRSAFLRELDAAGSTTDPGFPMGSGGSRLLDGNSTYAEALEREIAGFHGAADGLVCNSGFDANVGLFACLPQPGDVVVFDEYIHASVHDGMRASRAGECVAFAHNSVSAFRDVLRKCVHGDEALREGLKTVFVAVEAIYSMDGDVAPLREIVDVIDEVLVKGNGCLIVDEAHSTGVLGPRGRGLVNALGLENRVPIRLHTFGKALACNGAIILSNPLIRQYLLNYARPLIYTTFLSHPSLAAIRASYTLLGSPQTTSLQRTLQSLVSHLYSLLVTLEQTLRPGTLLMIPSSCPPSPIFSLLSSEARALSKWCAGRSYVVRPIVPPTVEVGKERIRVCLHAGNTRAEVEGLVREIGEWVLSMQGKGKARL